MKSQDIPHVYYTSVNVKAQIEENKSSPRTMTESWWMPWEQLHELYFKLSSNSSNATMQIYDTMYRSPDSFSKKGIIRLKSSETWQWMPVVGGDENDESKSKSTNRYPDCESLRFVAVPSTIQQTAFCALECRGSCGCTNPRCTKGM